MQYVELFFFKKQNPFHLHGKGIVSDQENSLSDLTSDWADMFQELKASFNFTH